MSGKQKGPTAAWFKSMDELYASQYRAVICTELYARKDLVKSLGSSATSFIQWAAYRRLSFYPDIDEEVAHFLSGNFGVRKRSFQTSARAWKLVCATVFKRDGYRCQYCGQVGGILECDHKIPFSRGGSDELENLATSCCRCNRKKRDRTPEEFKTLFPTL